MRVGTIRDFRGQPYRIIEYVVGNANKAAVKAGKPDHWICRELSGPRISYPSVWRIA
jgi:hypothetical protein